jgi:hypothetical protein
MKKVEIKMMVLDNVSRDTFNALDGVKEVNDYQETKIKHDDLLDSYSFENLIDGAKMFAEGIWRSIKGFGIMSLWSIVCIVQGIKWVWNKAMPRK